MSPDLTCSAQEMQGHCSLSPGSALPDDSSHRDPGEVSGLHLPICETGALDLLLFKRPASPEVGWGGLERGFQKGGLFSSDLMSRLLG